MNGPQKRAKSNTETDKSPVKGSRTIAGKQRYGWAQPQTKAKYHISKIIKKGGQFKNPENRVAYS